MECSHQGTLFSSPIEAGWKGSCRPAHKTTTWFYKVGYLQQIMKQLHLRRRAVYASPEAVKDGEQQQRIFGRLSQRLSAFHQQTRLFDGCLRLSRCIALGMHQGVRKPDLELDLLPYRACVLGRLAIRANARL